MKTCVALLLCVGLATAADAPKADPPAGDQKKLEGMWTVVSAEMRGEKKEDLVGTTVTFAGDNITIRVKGKDADQEGKFKLDPSATPKRLDVTPRGADKPMLGIYELDGGDLRLCLADKPEEERPAKFETQAGRKVVLLVLKRNKP
jgi:uncharacterized protein (TIGR03067 family)